MLSETDLRELLDYQAQHPVISVYLNTEPSEGNADAYKLRLRTMLKEVNFPEDISAIERYFDHEYDRAGRSVAVFSCAPEGYFRSYSLAVPIRSRVRVSDHPHVKPLADLLDSYGGYGVALIDKQGARVFSFHLGELREQEGMLGEEVRHTKRGGSSSITGRRGGVAGQNNRVEEVTERNMRDAADFASRFFTENNVRRVLIGGADDNVGLFRSQLPKAWQSLIVGTFPMSMTAGKNEVLERAMQIGRDAERQREAQLIKTLVNNVSKGRGGVMQLDETLRCVHEGRVQSLVIREGYRAPGYRCQGCGYITSHQQEKCPFCENTFVQIPDAVEMAVRKVMQQGGDVEVLHEDQNTERFGHIGAILRY
jgi:peptide chain release factor subunit 1